MKNIHIDKYGRFYIDYKDSRLYPIKNGSVIIDKNLDDLNR